MAPAEHVERQVAVAVVIAVEEPPLLLAVHRIVGRIEIKEQYRMLFLSASHCCRMIRRPISMLKNRKLMSTVKRGMRQGWRTRFRNTGY
jgi:hypothetical protein